MCNFCKKIITNEEYDKMSFLDILDLSKAFIMKDLVLNTYHLFFLCGDTYYTGKYLENRKY